MSYNIKELLDSVIIQALNNVEIKHLEKKIRIKRFKTKYLVEEINNTNFEIRKLETIIFKKCKHSWVFDTSSYHQTQRYCEKCNLSNLPYVYK